MIAPKRLSVKFSLEDGQSIDPATVVSVFQRWIQQRSVDGLLIDVTNYAHVHNGPGVILIGHEGDYALDFSGGRVGLQYTLKQTDALPNLEEALNTALNRAIMARNIFGRERDLGKPRFDGSQFQLTILDRLNYPQETNTTVLSHLETIIPRLSGSFSFITPVEANDTRSALRFLAQATAMPILTV